MSKATGEVAALTMIRELGPEAGVVTKMRSVNGSEGAA